MKKSIEFIKNLVVLIKVYLRALRLAWDADARFLALTILAASFSAIVVPIQVWMTKLVIDQIAEIGATTQDDISNWVPLLMVLGIYLAIWLVSEFFQSISTSVQELFPTKLKQQALSLLLEKASSLNVAFYETPSYYDQMELANGQIFRFGNVAYYIFTLLVHFVSLISLLLLIAQVSPFLVLVLVITSLPRILAQSYFVGKKSQMIMRHVPAERKANYFASILATGETAKEIRLFGLQDYLLKGFRKSSAEYINSFVKISVSQEKINFLLSALSWLGTGFVWFYTIYMASRGQITIGDVALVFQAAERSRFALHQFFFYFSFTYENVFYLEKYFAFLDLSPEAVPGSLTQIDPASQISDFSSATNDASDFMGRLNVQGVSFSYPGSDKLVLKDISFTLEPGQTLALVGENGAGKTTLVKLLARLYDPLAGEISVNGANLRAKSPEEHYEHVGVIFQDFSQYDLSARENIGFGNVNSLDDTDRIEQAAAKGGALDLVEQLPNGLDTNLGKRFEGSVNLSGGEWQKIALSRAFMREGSILILDEPTASLDAYAESEIYARFAELSSGKTTILVTHRLSSVKMADKILVLKDGSLVEHGSHHELLALNGEYARMYNLQAERYT